MDSSELAGEILELKQRRRAVILAHNYQRGEVQDIADFVGDSLELSQIAARSEAEVIVFCGVHFMAETASILSPGKKVLLPAVDAGCPMADMITAGDLLEKKRALPGAAVVCYVNSPAAVKAESDICCTSANAVPVVAGVASEEVLFVPDQYLGHYVSTQTPKKITLWPGFCPTHAGILAEDVMRQKTAHPGAKVVVHPECRPEVIALADVVLSTGGMCRFARETDAAEVIVATEVGIIHRLRRENPQPRFLAASDKAVCPDMKLITLKKVHQALWDMAPEVRVAAGLRQRAKLAVDRMLGIGGN